MSVYTTADSKKDSAAEHIKQAIQDLHDFTSPNTWVMKIIKMIILMRSLSMKCN